MPVLRAGWAWSDGVLELLPSVQVWHIGLYRNEETLEPVLYYNQLPQAPTSAVLDPRPDAGDGRIGGGAVEMLKKSGVAAHQVRRA